MQDLFLSKLTLSHFRSHRRSEVVCDARPLAIVGPNGAGKTNLVEAVSLFSPGRGMRRSSAEDMMRRPEILGWKVTGQLIAQGQHHDIALESREGSARTLRIGDKPAPQSQLGHIARVLWLMPSMDRLWIEGAEGRRRFLDRITLSFTPDHGETVLNYEKAMRDRNRLLKDQVRDPAWFGALERQMAENGAAIAHNRAWALARIAEAQANATTEFPAADLVITHPDLPLPDTVEGLRSALEQSRPRDYHAGRSLVGPHRVDLMGTFVAKGVPAKDCSTGEQKALLISLILSNARALAASLGAPPILLLDEVAAHLDPDRRAALYDEIHSLGAQAWMTGTEPALFEALGDRAQYLEVTTNDAGVSSVTAI